MKARLAAAQIKITLNSQKNLERIKKMIKISKSNHVGLVVFPENFISGPNKQAILKKEAKLITEVQGLAKKHRLFVVGSHQEISGNKMYNTGFLIADNGKIIGKHRKIYLMPEEKIDGFTSNKKLKIFSTKFGKVAIAVCFDAVNKFSPSLVRKFKKMGADFLVVPTYSMKVHKRSAEAFRAWLSAHCFWNNTFVICASSVGNIPELGIKTFGQSLIICPKRGILKKGSQKKEELLIANLDTKILEKADQIDKKHILNFHHSIWSYR